MHGRGAQVLIGTLFVVWMGCFALSLDDVLSDTAYSPILLTAAETPEAYPRVAAFKVGLGAETSGLSVGDRLLALGETDLRGADYL